MPWSVPPERNRRHQPGQGETQLSDLLGARPGHPRGQLRRYWAKIKIGVDPDRKSNATFQIPYDEFFAQNHYTFDLIFINGLHDANQMEKALANSLKVLNPGGSIVMQNLNPISPGQQAVPATGRPGRLEGRCVEGMGQAEGHAR